MKSLSLRMALLIAGTLNACMGFVEIVASIFSGSSALFADSLDFFVDGANYFSSIFILKKSENVHEKFGKAKGYLMLIVGVGVLVWSLIKYMNGWIPQGYIMTIVGFFALLVNLISTGLLVKFQNKSLDLRAVWLCTRNDALGNILIIIAGYLTLYLSSPLPDMFVSLFMGILITQSGFSIIRGRGRGHNHSHY